MIYSFQEFQKYGEKFFNEAFENAELKTFNREYHKNVAPGGRFGGLDRHVFEVFWGGRPYDVELCIVDEFGHLTSKTSQNVLMEYGAQLRYLELADGRIEVFLYPAMADHLKVSFDFFIIDEIKDVSKLFKKRTLKKHWEKLVVFMKNTCLLGKPSFSDKLKMYWILHRFRYSEKNYQKNSKIWSCTKKLISVSFPVLFSGCGIFIIQCICDSKDLERIEEIQKNMLKVDSLSLQGMNEMNECQKNSLIKLDDIETWLYAIKQFDENIHQMDNNVQHQLRILKKTNFLLKKEVEMIKQATEICGQ